MAEIQAKKRPELGKGLNILRKKGVLPAVLYGEGIPSVPLSVSLRDFEKALRESGETSVLKLTIEADKVYNVLIHDVAVDPMTEKPIHADFYSVRMDRPIEAKVPLVFSGQSPAVQSEGGILVKVHQELEVKALPGDMPHEIEVDISRLGAIGDKLHVKDISLPKGVTSELDSEDVIALIEAPRSEAELEALEKPQEEVVPVEVKTEREIKAEAKAETEAAEETEEKSA